MEQPNPNTPPGAGGPPAGNEPPAGSPPATPSKYDQLAAKKGFKSHDDLATSYEALEPELGRSKTTIDKARKQLESAGYTLDDDGVIKPQGSPGAQPPGQFQQPGQHQPPGEVIYDPYTGQAIADPVAMQLARMPLGQREAFMFNALQDQRDKQQTASYQADSEITAKPEAKGFEDDVRKAMMQKPLAQRADKAVWEQTLWEVKGKRYDEDRKNWGAMGVDSFINKAGNQGLPGAGGVDASGGVILSAEDEVSYQHYKKVNPTQFKDRRHFAEYLTPSPRRS